jgi:nucleoside phosphorylase
MGEFHAASVATRLIQELKPSCIAMTGICAGRQGEVFLGDVIVADRVFKIDGGKLKAYYEQPSSEVIRKEEIFHDIQTYNLLPLWKHQVENFSKDWVKTIKGNRPRSYFHQEQWLLHKLYDHEADSDKEPSPLNHPQRKQECPAWTQVVQRLIQKGLLKKKGLGLTATAKRKVAQERLQYPDCLPSDPLEPEVRVAPIGTSSMVQQDPQLFSRLEKIDAKHWG